MLLPKEYHTVKVKEIDKSLKTIKNKIFKQILDERCKEIKEDGNTVIASLRGSEDPTGFNTKFDELKVKVEEIKKRSEKDY